MKVRDQIINFMQDTEKRLGACIEWRQFKIVISYEAYKLLQAEESSLEYRDPERGYDGGKKMFFGCEVEIDFDAIEGFVFVSDGLKLSPNMKQYIEMTEEIARRHIRSLLRFEAYEFRHGSVISPRDRRSVKNIQPVDCDRLADFFSAVADCIENHLKEGAEA